MKDSKSIMNSETNESLTQYEAGPYTNDSSVFPLLAPGHCRDMTCVLLATANVFIMVLGITGNGLVIWIGGFKIKKTVNTVWYLSLAVSDFLYCAFLPFIIVTIVKGTWVFGRSICKFLPLFHTINWLINITLLVIISVDRCVVTLFPVWAQNKRTIRSAWVIVLLAWVISPLPSMPVVFFYDVFKDKAGQICFLKYKYNEIPHEIISWQVCVFIFVFVIPFLIIIMCYVLIIQKLKKAQIAKPDKSFKIMTALIATFFICWMPHHFFNLLSLNVNYNNVTQIGHAIGITLAGANSFMNPILYAFLIKDFRKKIPHFIKCNI